MNEKYSELAWHIGITKSAVSSRVSPMSSAVTSEMSALPAWLRIAPFGLPVVPDVYISAHVSSGATATAGAAAGAAAISASYDCQPSGTRSASKWTRPPGTTASRSLIGATRSTSASCTTKARASQCVAMYSISDATSRKFTGTATSPARASAT